MVMNTGSFPKSLRAGVFAFTQLTYNDHKPLWPLLFGDRKTDQQYEELVAGSTFGLMPVKQQGANVTYQDESQAHTTRATQVVYASGYVITWEEKRFNKYSKLGNQRGARLAKSARRTQESVAANVFNRAHNSSYTFGDSKELCATDHSTLYGNQSNELATAADMSEASIEDICIMIMKATDNVGNKINLQPKRMAYAPDESFNACRILESEKQADSAQNNINALKSKGMIPEHFANPYFDDADAFFVLTDVADTDDGLLCFESFPFTPMMDNDSDNLNEKHFGLQSYVFTAGDFRSVYSNGGGA